MTKEEKNGKVIKVIIKEIEENKKDLNEYIKEIASQKPTNVFFDDVLVDFTALRLNALASNYEFFRNLFPSKNEKEEKMRLRPYTDFIPIKRVKNDGKEVETIREEFSSKNERQERTK